MSQKLGALFHEEVTALCTLTSEFHYLVVYFLPNASNASYGYGFCQHSEIVSPFPVLMTRDVAINESVVETESSRLIVFLTALF